MIQYGHCCLGFLYNRSLAPSLPYIIPYCDFFADYLLVHHNGRHEIFNVHPFRDLLHVFLLSDELCFPYFTASYNANGWFHDVNI